MQFEKKLFLILIFIVPLLLVLLYINRFSQGSGMPREFDTPRYDAPQYDDSGAKYI